MQSAAGADIVYNPATGGRTELHLAQLATDADLGGFTLRNGATIEGDGLRVSSTSGDSVYEVRERPRCTKDAHTNHSGACS